MTYKIDRIGDPQLEPPVMDKVDMEKFSCCCHPTCMHRVPESQLVECTETVIEDGKEWECGAYVWIHHLKQHIEDMHK